MCHTPPQGGHVPHSSPGRLCATLPDEECETFQATNTGSHSRNMTYQVAHMGVYYFLSFGIILEIEIQLW